MGNFRSGWRLALIGRRTLIVTGGVLRFTTTLTAPAVETFLLTSGGFGLIVTSAPFVGTLPAMMLPAAKRAAQILSPRIARMS
jgi:hypothetical protein